MARSDKGVFLGTLAQAEVELAALLQQLAHEVGDVVLRAAGPDGTVPVERLAEVQRRARALVDAALIGAGRLPIDEQGAGMTTPLGQIIGRGQETMIEVALERSARIMETRLPAEVLAALAARPLKRV